MEKWKNGKIDKWTNGQIDKYINIQARLDRLARLARYAGQA